MSAQNLILLLDIATTALEVQGRIVQLMQQYQGRDIPDEEIKALRAKSKELLDKWNAE